MEEKKHELLFGVRRSIRYHARRRRHFDQVNQISVALSLLFGSATIAAVLGIFTDAESAQVLVAIFAAIVTVSSTINLVLGSSSRARDHHDLERQFSSLERSILMAGDCDDASLTLLVAERLKIEEEEEPPLRVLDTLCHNELIKAMGLDTKHAKKVGPLQRLCSQWFDFFPDSIQ